MTLSLYSVEYTHIARNIPHLLFLQAMSLIRNPWHEVWCNVLELVSAMLRYSSYLSLQRRHDLLLFLSLHQGWLIALTKWGLATKWEADEGVSSMFNLVNTAKLEEIEKIGGMFYWVYLRAKLG